MHDPAACRTQPTHARQPLTLRAAGADATGHAHDKPAVDAHLCGDRGLGVLQARRGA